MVLYCSVQMHVHNLLQAAHLVYMQATNAGPNAVLTSDINMPHTEVRHLVQLTNSCSSLPMMLLHHHLDKILLCFVALSTSPSSGIASIGALAPIAAAMHVVVAVPVATVMAINVQWRL